MTDRITGRMTMVTKNPTYRRKKIPPIDKENNMLKYMLGNRNGDIRTLLYLNTFSFAFMTAVYYIVK